MGCVMLKKRLIGVITVRGGWAVQSFGYRRYLPLGRPEVLADNLDRWGVDEIVLQCMDRSVQGLGPDFDLLDRIARLGLSTPLIYLGGVRHAGDGVQVVQMGADRVGVDTLLRADLNEVVDMSSRLGAQALVASLPLVRQGPEVLVFDHQRRTQAAIDPRVAGLLREGVVSEAFVIDCQHEGEPGGFDADLLNNLPFGPTPLIPFGGISEPAQMAQLLAHPLVVGVGVGNFLSYREHAVRLFKQALPGLPLRHPA